jgi:signal transduction histidine kinase
MMARGGHHGLLGKGTLGRRVLVLLVVGELLFAVALGITIGGFSLLALVHEREQAARDISTVIAAGIMPTVADQRAPQVEAQVASILATSGTRDLRGICVTDASRQLIACQGEIAHAAEEQATETISGWSLLTEHRTVTQPVVVSGLEVATIRVRFAPPGLAESMRMPTLAALVLVASTVLVSVPWTAYRLVHDVTEPLVELTHHTSRIAAGDMEVTVGASRSAELRDPEEAFGGMARRWGEREAELRRSYDELSEAYVSLEQAKHEIENLAMIKENFVAIAAHEIRGPLATIRLYADLMQSGGAGELDVASASAVSAIQSAASRLSSITSDLMDAALLERGLLTMDIGEVWVGTLVEDAVRDADILARSVGRRVEFVGELPDALIPGDRVRLRQVLDNVLSNAVKYSPTGSTVTVQADESAEWVEIEVADVGRGIPADDRGRLFSLFGRVDFGESRGAVGLGLGLAISARILEAHGGRITYRENPMGVGSVFTVRLPADDSLSTERGPVMVDVFKEGEEA